MSNSGTPIGENGRGELKVTRTNDADKLLDKYFEDLKREGYGKIQIRALTFDVPEVAIKSKGRDEEEKTSRLSDIINVLDARKREIDLKELLEATAALVKSADKEKVADKVKKIKAEKAAKKEKTEKPDSREER